MARTATNSRRATSQRAARTASRTKQVVRLIKKTPDFDALDVVKMYVPENKLNHMNLEAKNELMKMGAGLVSIVNAGQFDLRTAMK